VNGPFSIRGSKQSAKHKYLKIKSRAVSSVVRGCGFSFEAVRMPPRPLRSPMQRLNDRKTGP